MNFVYRTLCIAMLLLNPSTTMSDSIAEEALQFLKHKCSPTYVFIPAPVAHMEQYLFLTPINRSLPVRFPIMTDCKPFRFSSAVMNFAKQSYCSWRSIVRVPITPFRPTPIYIDSYIGHTIRVKVSIFDRQLLFFHTCLLHIFPKRVFLHLQLSMSRCTQIYFTKKWTKLFTKPRLRWILSCFACK